MKPALNGTDYTSGNTMELSKSFEKEFQEDLESSFFWNNFKMVFECFPSLLDTKSLTHNLTFTGTRDLATAKIPRRWTTAVKNRYSVQIANFAT